MSLQYLKKELSYEIDVLHDDKHESLLRVDIIFDGFGQVSQITRVNLQYFCEILRKKPGMKWGINCTGWFKCYFIIHPVFSHHWPFMGQYGIHIKSFIHLINCLYNISLLLLFQVTVGPYNFFFFFFFTFRFYLFFSYFFLLIHFFIILFTFVWQCWATKVLSDHSLVFFCFFV